MRTILSGLVFAWVACESQAAPVDFNRDIKPILSQNCFQCHGPDEKTRKADLRLDRKEGFGAKTAAGPVTTPKEPDESELFLRIVSEDPDERMPPPDSGKNLTEKQISLIRQWIEEGAVWKGHWAYEKPARPEIPRGTAKHPIDRLIEARLKSLGMKPGAMADRRTLIRRINFDLLGLSPTPEEVEKFVKDPRGTAYEELVDRTLASPHFGERMAQYWLDLVRYADTNGYHGDNHEDRDLYRDYVINSFNDNLPFDRFTIEQLAGDLLENRTNEQWIASGYNRLLMTTREGGAQAKEYLAKYSADRVRNVSGVWLGSTMGCAECHDHKYDPFSTKDFYRMAAFFADIQEVAVGEQPTIPLPTRAQEEENESLQKQLLEARAELEVDTEELTIAESRWTEEQQKAIDSAARIWTMVKPKEAKASEGTVLELQEDLSLLATQINPPVETYLISLPLEEKQATGVRIEALTHPSLTDGSLSRANGNFVVTEFEVQYQDEAGELKSVKLKEALADYAQDDFPVAHAIDGKKETGWAVNGHARKENCTAVLVFAEAVPAQKGRTLIVAVRQESIYQGHNVGRLRLSLTDVATPGLQDTKWSPDLLAALQTPAEKRSDAEKTVIRTAFRASTPLLEQARKSLAEKEERAKQLQIAFRRTLVTTAMAPREIRVLPRGNWLDENNPALDPEVPEFLGVIGKSERASRMDLARWMTSPDNPLVSRVFVNRVWMILFGDGLVRSADDFGAQGQAPSNPELLDYLAIEFRDSGWDVKKLVKLIVLSEAYRRSSLVPPGDQDPFNQGLARQGRFRLDAEFIRDQALASSGLLVGKIGGISVRPYQPPKYWAYLNFPIREYQADTGESLYRRGLYTYWCRTFLHPSLKAFDAPTREECTVVRGRSNTPLQALVLLNDPVYVEAARSLATQMLMESKSDPEQRIQWMFLRVLQREPRSKELEILREVVRKHRSQFEKDSEAVHKLLAIGESQVPAQLDRVELAAWTSAARIILNLHETITRE